MSRQVWRASAAAVALGIVVGCGPGRVLDSSSSDTATEATVTGTVRVFDAMVKGGTITFDPSNVDRKGVMPRSSPIGKDGSYSVTTLVGRNVVSVFAPETTTGKGAELEYELIPFDVPAEGGSFDVVLPRPTAP